MDEEILKQYQLMASQMNAVAKSSRWRKQRYHFLADAVYWTDEVPHDLETFSENCLRFLLRYRMSLIQGRPEDKWRVFWEEAKRQFPDWIGFAESRCRPDARILKKFDAAKAEADNDLERLLDKE